MTQAKKPKTKTETREEHLVLTESGTLEVTEECYEGARFIRRTITTLTADGDEGAN